MTKSIRELIVVVGATGSGKTSLSIALARHFGAPIISTDSRQFYRGIPIGTAQPTVEELTMAEHHFIACRELNEDFNAGAYEVEALERLEQLFEANERVVAVGGSGLYIKALCEGLDSLPDCDPELRADIRRRYNQDGLEPLLDELKRLDPEYWASVDRCNPARVMRGLELCLTSGMPCSQLRTGEVKRRNFRIIKVGIDIPREELYERINRRVDDMIAEGLESEVRNVYPLRSLNSLQTVGYRELFDYMDGIISRDEAIELIKRNSRRYAKRQMTWFRRDADIEWFASPEAQPVIRFIESLQ
ncbi:MAG: tRNA (adenosine(37)-N6)-dimethylallyltransferase MiaA [Rikenellaceae bacterium]